MLIQMEEELLTLSESNKIKKEIEIPDENAYTKEYRKKLYKELEEERIKQEEEKKKNKTDTWNLSNDYDSKKLPVYREDGEIRVCNQGRYAFFIDEDVKIGIVTFELATPKFMDTSQIKVDLNPKYIRVEVKEKATQWRLEKDEIYTENALVQRSQTTGYILIKAFMMTKGEYNMKGIDVKKLKKDDLSMKNTSKLTEHINQEKERKLKEAYEKSSKKPIYYNDKEKKDLKGLSYEDLLIVNNKNNVKRSNNDVKKGVISYEKKDKIDEVDDFQSEINPNLSKNKKLDMNEVIKGVNLDEIPDLE